jgi:hypothetical protein
MRFPVGIFLREPYFQQLFSGKRRRTDFIGRISTGRVFLATNSQKIWFSKVSLKKKAVRKEVPA